MKHYLFPKYFNHFSLDELMEKCVELGIDGPTLMIREDYWVDDNNYRETIPAYVAAAKAHGLEVKYADTNICMDKIDEYVDQLKVMKENGIEQFRLWYVFRRDFVGRVREMEGFVRENLTRVAEIAKEIGIQAIVQIHGRMYPLSASTAYACVKGMDPRYIGIKMDPGNNFSVEGYEEFDYQVELLGDYIAALGAKNAALFKEDAAEDGTVTWKRDFVPANEGCANYPLIFSELKKANFNGPVILMPFYHEEDYEAMEKDFIKEIAYFKDVEKQAGY
jgi:sugar phosphate isomerase/epimerase